MFNMTPFRKNYLTRRDDLFSPLLRNLLDDDLYSVMNYVDYMHGSFRVDLKETDEEYVVEADLPGIKKENIEIDFSNNRLVISAERDESLEEKKENYVRRERHFGKFKRGFYMDNVDENKIQASFNDGVLKVTLPKITKGRDSKRKIDIN